MYAVVLFDQAAQELGTLVQPWLRKSELGHYIYARQIDPSEPYLQMLIESRDPDGVSRDVELQIPHPFVKAIINAADISKIGFT
jgi:hypothetical protein